MDCGGPLGRVVQVLLSHIGPPQTLLKLWGVKNLPSAVAERNYCGARFFGVFCVGTDVGDATFGSSGRWLLLLSS